jgi:hypothetical protein
MNKIAPKIEFEPMAVTTMVDVPILSEAERAELLASLEEARQEIRDGKGLTFTADEFRVWFKDQVKAARARKQADGL